ncbi:OmpH family outer membrane protein [Candidatus Dependentiae bacterium]|nr:OmpH family outer membrane protein [Candidatus Dependentiae bacterium]MCC7415429.1 OmpH family outer membrane protein [Campylobacterota bacterium]
MISQRTAVVLTVGLVASSLYADESEHVIKIRVINSAEVMQVSEVGKQEGEKMKALEKGLREGIDKKQQQVRKAEADLQAKASTLSPAAADKEKNKLLAMGLELETLAKTSEAEFKDAYQRAAETLFNETRQAVMEVAKQQDLDLVFDGNTGQLMYASDNALITNDIVKAMDKNFNKTQKAPAPKPAAPKAPAVAKK